MWHMRGVFEDMLLYGGVLLARAAGEAAGGTFFAGEAVASANPRFSGSSVGYRKYPNTIAITFDSIGIGIVCDDLLLRGTGTFSLL